VRGYHMPSLRDWGRMVPSVRASNVPTLNFAKNAKFRMGDPVFVKLEAGCIGPSSGVARFACDSASSG
jgi:hypothetical protein